MGSAMERMKAKAAKKTKKDKTETPKRRGRPKKVVEETEEEETEEEETEEEETEEETPTPKRRGPKPGTKRVPRKKTGGAPAQMVKALLKEVEAMPATWELVDALMTLVREED